MFHRALCVSTERDNAAPTHGLLDRCNLLKKLTDIFLRISSKVKIDKHYTIALNNRMFKIRPLTETLRISPPGRIQSVHRESTLQITAMRNITKS